MLKYIILGFLNLRPMTGYDIKQLMTASTEHFWDAKLSQIYTTLKKMSETGIVDSYIEPQADRPNRRIYSLTETGRAELRGWLNAMELNRETKKDPLLLKIFFSLPTDHTHLIAQLRLHLDLHQEQLRSYETESPQVIQDFIAEQHELVDHVELWELTRQFGVMYEQTYIKWLQMAIEQLSGA